ncbi:MAG: AAA family ATPase [Candidatus Binataceae bacterium]
MESSRELVILVGVQGAGKTSFYLKHFGATHVHVSKDLLRNSRNRQARQLALIEQALRIGKSIVVDNTNPQIEDRAPLIALGKAFRAWIVGYRFESSISDCLSRNTRREGRARVPDVAICSTARKLQPPTEMEGFDALFRVDIRNDGFQIKPEYQQVETARTLSSLRERPKASYPLLSSEC